MLGGIALVAAAPIAAAVGLGAAGYGIAKSIKNKKNLEEENKQLREELAKKNS
jgi:cell shape-determining protein MreC